MNKGESTEIQSIKSFKCSSFFKQLREVIGSKELREMDIVGILDQLEMDFTCHDTELRGVLCIYLSVFTTEVPLPA